MKSRDVITLHHLTSEIKFNLCRLTNTLTQKAHLYTQSQNNTLEAQFKFRRHKEGCSSIIVALSGSTHATVSRVYCCISEANFSNRICLMRFSIIILELESCGFLHYDLEYLCHHAVLSIF